MSISRIGKKYFLTAISGAYIGQQTDVDIAVRCPICGDSKKKQRSTRLHLYNKGTDTDFVTCFNGDCAVGNKTVYSFLRDFYPGLIQGYKKELFGYTIKALANGSSNADVFSNFKTEVQEPVQTQDLSLYLRDIQVEEQALQYLKTRGLDYTSKFGKWYYGYQNLQIDNILYPITDSIVIPLYYKNVMYGFYSRSIKDKSFYTYMSNDNIGFKIWNWFNINKEEPVYIYEGIFDAISGALTNSIALMGAKIPPQRLKELKYPVFVLDNDKTGLLNSINYSKMGYSVYIQPSLYQEKDMNELMLNNPDIKVNELIKNNLFKGISAEVRIKSIL